ncbi:MAG: tetratricopeptide repeat protein [Rhizobiaceae bacterium]
MKSAARFDLILSLPVILLLAAFPGNSIAGQVRTFGQMIDKNLNDQVSRARLLRLGVEGQPLDVDQSIEILTSVTNSNPGFYRAQYNLGLALLKKHPDQPEHFLPALEKAAEIETTDSNIKDGSIYNTLGWSLLTNLKYDEAETYLRKGLDYAASNSDWTNSALNFNMGRLYFETQRYDKAKKFLSVAADSYGNPTAIEMIATIDKLKPPAN